MLSNLWHIYYSFYVDFYIKAEHSKRITMSSVSEKEYLLPGNWTHTIRLQLLAMVG